MLRLLSLQIFEDPSVYSHKPVARLQVQMGRYIDTSSRDIPGFNDRLISDFPGLSIHQCSKNYAGGFLERLQVGTYLPHIIEHLCLETQTILGYDVRYGKTRWVQEDVYSIIFAYKDKHLVKPIVDFILGYIRRILSGDDFDFKGGLEVVSNHMSLKGVVGTKRELPFIIANAKRGVKSPVTDLLVSVLMDKGFSTGLASLNGVYKNNERIKKKSMTFKSMASLVLTTKDIDVAVLELDSQNILAEGLPYPEADVAIIAGLLDEHLGERYIETIDQLLHIKSLVIEAVKADGVSILNADDPYFPELVKRVRSRIVLFGMNKNIPAMEDHISSRGEAVFCFEDGIYFIKDTLATRVLDFKDMPAFYVGSDYVYDIMAAICTTYACAIPVEGTGHLVLSQLRKELLNLSHTPRKRSLYVQ
ncbi:MAG TPA: Mur ligase family protein [Bacillota bacterium]|nr:Mur ligase family protein [Bacillota bacterium]